MDIIHRSNMIAIYILTILPPTPTNTERDEIRGRRGERRERRNQYRGGILIFDISIYFERWLTNWEWVIRCSYNGVYRFSLVCYLSIRNDYQNMVLFWFLIRKFVEWKGIDGIWREFRTFTIFNAAYIRGAKEVGLYHIISL